MTDSKEARALVERLRLYFPEFERQDCIHVIPINDLREHECRADCWCNPTPDDEEPFVIVHHSMDRREEYEEGRAKS